MITPDHVNTLYFLFGSLFGAALTCFGAAILHKKSMEDINNHTARKISDARRKAYSQGYEHRAALEFVAREEQG